MVVEDLTPFDFDFIDRCAQQQTLLKDHEPDPRQQQLIDLGLIAIGFCNEYKTGSYIGNYAYHYDRCWIATDYGKYIVSNKSAMQKSLKKKQLKKRLKGFLLVVLDVLQAITPIGKDLIRALKEKLV